MSLWVFQGDVSPLGRSQISAYEGVAARIASISQSVLSYYSLWSLFAQSGVQHRCNSALVFHQGPFQGWKNSLDVLFEPSLLAISGKVSLMDARLHAGLLNGRPHVIADAL